MNFYPTRGNYDCEKNYLKAGQGDLNGGHNEKNSESAFSVAGQINSAPGQEYFNAGQPNFAPVSSFLMPVGTLLTPVR